MAATLRQDEWRIGSKLGTTRARIEFGLGPCTFSEASAGFLTSAAQHAALVHAMLRMVWCPGWAG